MASSRSSSRFIETGPDRQVPQAYPSQGGLIAQVEGAAYAAFGDGLHAAFYLSAALVILAGLPPSRWVIDRLALDIIPR